MTPEEREVLLPQWTEWLLCNRLQCTPEDLHRMDAGQVELMTAFMLGEAAGAKQKADANSLGR